MSGYIHGFGPTNAFPRPNPFTLINPVPPVVPNKVRSSGRTHIGLVWQGTAADKAEALQSAERADPWVDLEWMRVRYERDLNKR